MMTTTALPLTDRSNNLPMAITNVQKSKHLHREGENAGAMKYLSHLEPEWDA